MRLERGTEAAAETAWCKLALPDMTGVELMHVAALASSGQKRAAGSAMRDVVARSGQRYTSPVFCALAYTELGEPDNAIEWLKRAATDRDYWMLNVGVDPAFDPLRVRAEYAAVFQSVGLPG